MAEDGVPEDAAGGSGQASEGAGAPAGGEDAGGRHWLKYAGIGGHRKPGPGGGRLRAITSLGSLEAEVLGVLWEIGRPATGMEVMEHSLYKRRARGEEPASFATIATTLRRLTQKGLLTSEKHEQRTPVYAPTVNREEMAARILNNVSETLLGRPLHALLPRLVGGFLPPTPDEGTGGDDAGASRDANDPEVQQLLQALEELARREEGDPHVPPGA
ncbi:MAG: BlaI/MecI/CopY family transcriptional regulator [Armatimonadetes bacterium]|nr:BlaI/MecI/CopY family transcriptional regulator [Armatimonadota bacterium]